MNYHRGGDEARRKVPRPRLMASTKHKITR